MSTNKSISYILCNKGIIVNLYKLHFPSFPFSLQPNKRVFHPSNQTHKRENQIFYILPLFYSNQTDPKSVHIENGICHI